MVVKFLICSGKHQGKRLTVSREETIIGRDAECHIRIASEDVSRQHCQIVVNEKEKTVSIQDLGSQNGTFVNEQAIDQQVRLRPGDTIRIGPMVLQLPKKKRATPVKDTSDNEIATWLTDDNIPAVNSSDSTIINIVVPPERQIDPPESSESLSDESVDELLKTAILPKSKLFDSVAEEAADIIRRHYESQEETDS